ncbi:MAG: ATP-grasp domain-containing protein [Candidatus Hydrothermarchaeales archaeon]
MEGSILIVGIHTRPAVFSAKRAGLEVYSVDYFGSMDTQSVADISRSIIEQKPYKSMGRMSVDYSGEKLVELSKDLNADYVILASTVDLKKKNILGNRPEVMRRIKDKEYQLRKVEKLGFRIPETEVITSREEAIEVAKNFGFPVVIKPVKGAGGRGITLVKAPSEIPEIVGKMLIQRYVKGKKFSVSTISTRDHSKMLSTSIQILGSKLLNQKNFVYCGNIIPFLNLDKKMLKEIEGMAVDISRAFDVIGWNGIDLTVSEEPVFMELNPRFQGTFDCVERAYGINLIDAHIKACEGELIEVPHPKNHSVRMTLFAKKRSIVTQSLEGLSLDVPCKYAIIEEGEPITTVVESSANRKHAIMNAVGKIKAIYRNSIAKYPT